MKYTAGLRAPLASWRNFSSIRWGALRAILAPSLCSFSSKLTFYSPVSCGPRRYYASSSFTSSTEELSGKKLNAKPKYSQKGMDGFTDVKYNKVADAFLMHIEIVIDDLLNDNIKDINLSDGVLTIETTQGTFLFNKQAPNLQMWLSSPISGPHHYNMVESGEKNTSTNEEKEENMKSNLDEVRWICERDGHDLTKKIEEELSEVLGVKIAL
ncbi:unnamed protein product [Phytomonas sp. Hart1]|nr:unnamed protein product [Phytomonas sp. Hart1]|eukprot:CCW70915.1 unnamed protein product [Phytomonas sp. isolate Hart1]